MENLLEKFGITKKKAETFFKKDEIVEVDGNVKIYKDEEGNYYTKETLFESLVTRTLFVVGGDNLDPSQGGSQGGDNGNANGGDKTALIGQYMEPIGKFDVAKAVEYGVRHANSKSLGKCARYVREMIEAGGVNLNGHPVSAYLYASFLPSKGFACVATISTKAEQAKWTNSNAKPGDVAVMAHGKHGHICMYSGKKWISDFVQNNMWPYSGDGTVNIFRFKG